MSVLDWCKQAEPWRFPPAPPPPAKRVGVDPGFGSMPPEVLPGGSLQGIPISDLRAMFRRWEERNKP